MAVIIVIPGTLGESGYQNIVFFYHLFLFFLSIFKFILLKMFCLGKKYWFIVKIIKIALCLIMCCLICGKNLYLYTLIINLYEFVIAQSNAHNHKLIANTNLFFR